MEADALSRGVRSMFYMVTPNESSFQHVDDVPSYVQQATPYFMGLMVLELLLGYAKSTPMVFTIRDGLTSVSAGMVSRLPELFMRTMEMNAYIYVWNHFHVLELPWDSAWTWWFTFLGVDLGYYVIHRLAHELNIVWAAHQVHHSSEYYNLTTALRQSLTLQFTSWVFYLPLALAVPPSVFAVHLQLNLLYQFWIHTEVIRNLGPLEWILNTPSHHRVHHGRNLYCIDKNFGGTLIIWDRIFGTFAPETDKVIYGLVVPVNTFEILTLQFHYYQYLWSRVVNAKTLVHKLSVVFKGPSWSPGQPRLGDHTQYPQVTGKELPYDPSWPVTSQVYVVLHFLLVLAFYQEAFAATLLLPRLSVLLMSGYILFTLTSLGFIMDQRPRAAILETLRCVVMVMMLRSGFMASPLPWLATPIQAFVSLSLLFWGLQSFSQPGAGKKSQ